MPLFPIVLPIVRLPLLLPFAVSSVLRQTLRDWELFIVLDGAPDETWEVAKALAAKDTRIAVRRFPKGERNGEVHRDTVLREATGALIAQIGDDDLWFPDHLAELTLLLADADFGNLLQCEIGADGATNLLLGDLTLPATRRSMVATRWNFFGPSCAGYTRAAYDRLPTGWSAAPVDLHSDLFMWRKFLALPDIRVATRFVIEAAKPATSRRTGMSLSQRAVEVAQLERRFATGAGRSSFREQAWRSVVASTAGLGPNQSSGRLRLAWNALRHRG